MSSTTLDLNHSALSEADQRAFRSALGAYPTGVAVACTLAEDGQPVGLTINSFASVSLDPPLVLWSIDMDAACTPSFLACDRWSLSMLSQDQEATAMVFAAPSDHPSQRFGQVDWTKGEAGLPLIANAITTFECKAEAAYPGGDHHILVGRVLRFNHAPGHPLVFHRGQFKRL